MHYWGKSSHHCTCLPLWGSLILNKIKQAPDECLEVLKSGGFSIRRTTANYARSAVDLCLEQTVNKNAASPSRGLVHIHSSHGAIVRWCASSHGRSMAVHRLKDMVNYEGSQNSCTTHSSARHRCGLGSSTMATVFRIRVLKMSA